VRQILQLLFAPRYPKGYRGRHRRRQL